VRDFAKATGQLAKTDRSDARVLAHFGAALVPRVTLARASDVDALPALLDRPRQLVETRTAEKNLRNTAPAAVRGSIDDHIAGSTSRSSGSTTPSRRRPRPAPYSRSRWAGYKPFRGSDGSWGSPC